MSQLPSTSKIEGQDLQPQSLLLIVVGAHLRAEMHDRPLAYRLREQILRKLDVMERQSAGETIELVPLVCTDVWYLNNRDLLERPTIALGEPGVNAASAYLCNRLPTAFVIDNSLRVHLDPEFTQAAQACIWGVNASAMVSGIDLFVERYLDEFLVEASGK